MNTIATPVSPYAIGPGDIVEYYCKTRATFTRGLIVRILTTDAHGATSYEIKNSTDRLTYQVDARNIDRVVG